MAIRTVRAQPERIRRIVERQPDAARAGRGIGLRCDLADGGRRCDVRTDEKRHLKPHIRRKKRDALVGDVEYGITRVWAGDRYCGLTLGDHLADLGRPGGYNAVIVAFQHRVAELFLRFLQGRCDLIDPRLRAVTRRGGGIQLRLAGTPRLDQFLLPPETSRKH